jgi:hypothetical protein
VISRVSTWRKILPAAVLGICVFISRTSGRDCPPELLQLASDSLVAESIAIVAGFSGRPDSAEMVEARQLELKDCMSFSIEGRRTTAAIIGNYIFGEIVVLDSSGNVPTQRKLRIALPSRFASFGELKDVNHDGTPELPIYQASGSHGQYLVLVSLHRDSLSFIRDEKGHYQFFASGGDIRVIDLDSDGIYEIVLTKMAWGDDPPGKSNQPPKTVYRWCDGKYVMSTEAESPESK